MANIYIVATIALVALAAILYNSAPERVAEDVEELSQSITLLFPDLYDVVSNPSEEYTIAVGADSTIVKFSDRDSKAVGRINVAGSKSDLISVANSDDGRIVIAAGDSGTILKSNDYGKSWTLASTNTGKHFNRIVLSKNGKTAVAVGRDGLIRVSNDSGNTWFNPGNITSEDINDVALNSDGTKAYAVTDDNEILVSRGDFKNWSTDSDYTVGTGRQPDLNSVEILSQDGTDIVVVVGDDKTVKTFCNNGEWKPHFDEQRGRRFKSVAISGDENPVAIAVGRRGAISISSNLCGLWKTIDGKVGDDLEEVALSIGGELAVAVGDDGVILVSEDSGASWNLRDTMTPNALFGVTFGIDSDSVVAVGENATIFRLDSTDDDNLNKLVRLDTEITETKTKEIDVSRSVKQPTTSMDASNLTFYLLSLDRGGTVLILIVLIQFLKSLARYSLRLSAFYDARRDAMGLITRETTLQPNSIEEQKQMICAMSPDDLGFEYSTEPSTRIVERLVRLIKRA